jgi:hypothetical protein
MEFLKIDRLNCMEIILQEFPAFQTQWDSYIESWNSLIDRPIALDIAEFADFAVDIICLGSDIDIDRLTTTLEIMLCQDDSVVNYAFRMMFLSQIAHRRHLAGVRLDLFISKLQPLGFYHWQALDRELAIYPSGTLTN